MRQYLGNLSSTIPTEAEIIRLSELCEPPPREYYLRFPFVHRWLVRATRMMLNLVRATRILLNLEHSLGHGSTSSVAEN